MTKDTKMDFQYMQTGHMRASCISIKASYKRKKTYLRNLKLGKYKVSINRSMVRKSEVVTLVTIRNKTFNV